MLTTLLGYFAGVRRSKSELETKQLETSADSERKQMVDRGHFENRLIGRIESLEHRLDEQHRECREELLAAIQRAEAECEAKMMQHDRKLRRDIEKRLSHELDELSEPS